MDYEIYVSFRLFTCANQARKLYFHNGQKCLALAYIYAPDGIRNLSNKVFAVRDK